MSPGDVSGIGQGTSGDRRAITAYQLASDVILNKGRNTFQFGFMWIHQYFNGFQPARDAGNYSFSNTEDFFGNADTNTRPLVNRFRGSVFDCCDDPYRSYKQNITGLYFQDELRLTPRITITPGLRYEFITVPSEKWGRVATFKGDISSYWQATQDDIVTGNPWAEHPSLKNFTPRIGLAWDVFGDGRMAVRYGFGLFFQHLDQTWTRTMGFRMPPTLIEVEGRGSKIPFPGIFGLCSQDDPKNPATPGCDIATPVPNWLPYQFSTPYVMQYNLNIQRQLGSDMILTVGYTGSRGVRLPSVSDVNTQVGVDSGGRLVFPDVGVRPNQNFDRMWMRHPMANSWYNALQISAQKRMSQGLQFNLAYTFAKTLDEISGSQTSSDTDTGANTSYYHDHTLLKGRSAFDARNVFTFSSTYELPFGSGRFFGSGMSGVADAILGGWEVGGILTLRGGFPFTIARGVRTEMGDIGIGDELPDLVAGFSSNPTSGTSAGCKLYPDIAGQELAVVGLC